MLTEKSTERKAQPQMKKKETALLAGFFVFFRRWELTQLNLPVQGLLALIHRHALFEFFKPVHDDVDFGGGFLCGFAVNRCGLP